MRKNPWIYYGKKLLIFVVSIFLLSVMVVYIARLAPGDPLVSYYGERAEDVYKRQLLSIMETKTNDL